VKTREELEENQMKRYNWEQDQIAHMKVKQCSLVALLLCLSCTFSYFIIILLCCCHRHIHQSYAVAKIMSNLFP